MRNSVRCTVLLMVILSVAASGQEAAHEAGVWQLEEVKAFHTPKDQIKPLSPWNCKAFNGEATSEIVLGHLNPPGQQRVLVKWTQPPKAMTPGEVVRLGLSAEMLANDVQGAADIKCYVVADIEGSDMAPWQASREGRVRFVEGEKRRIELTEKTAPGTIMRLDAQATPPPFGMLKSGETGKIQLRVIVVHQYLLAFQYIYKWAPRPEPGETAAAKPTPPTKPVESPRVVPSAPPSGVTPKSRPMSGGFPKDALPPAIEEKTEIVPARGGVVQLPGGAKLTIPPGAAKEDVKIAFRRLPSAQKDCALYHVESSVESMDVPVELEFPLPGGLPPEGTDYSVEVLLIHNESDPGRVLPVESAKGEPFVRVRTKDLSVFSVVVIWGAKASGVGLAAMATAEAYCAIVNRDTTLQQAVNDALAEAAKKGKSTVMPLQIPYYSKEKVLLCWAAAMSTVTHAACGTAKQLEKPTKPQLLVSKVEVHINAGLSAWRYLMGTSSEPFAYIQEVTGCASKDMEVSIWRDYGKFIKYAFGCLAEGYPVVVDVMAMTHTIVIVGYDADGFWVQDNEVAPPVIHVPWRNFFVIIKYKQALKALNTLVIKQAPAIASPLSINVPRCDLEGGTGIEANRYGCYFTTPHNEADDFKHAAFMWDGCYPQGDGMKLVTGGEEKTHVDPLEVGVRTEFGFRNVEVANISKAEVACSLKVVLVDPTDKQEIVVMKETSYRVPGAETGKGVFWDKGCGAMHNCSSAGEIPFLPLLPEAKKGVRKWILRFCLLCAGQEVDCVNIPLTLNPLRIDDISTTVSGGAKEYCLSGNGFEMKGVTPILVMGANRRVPRRNLEVEPMKQLAVKSPTEASFSLPEKLQPLAISLRADSGIESNEYPLTVAPVEIALQHEGGATLVPGDNLVKVTCTGTLTGPAGTLAKSRSLFEHGAQLLDVFAMTGWEEPVQITLSVRYELSKKMKWDWPCTLEDYKGKGRTYAETTLSNPRLQVIPNSPHANKKSTHAVPTLNLVVPTGRQLVANSGTGNIAQQFSGLAALAFDKKTCFYVQTKEGTERVKIETGVAMIYILHFQVDRNP